MAPSKPEKLSRKSSSLTISASANPLYARRSFNYVTIKYSKAFLAAVIKSFRFKPKIFRI